MNDQRPKKKKKKSSPFASPAAAAGSTLNQRSSRQPLDCQAGKGGGLSCQSLISHPKPQGLIKFSFLRQEEVVSRFRPNSPLSSSFSSWEAQACQNILRKSFKHLQPLDLVRQGEMSRARPRARLSVAPGFQELVGPADTPSTRTGYWGPRAPAIPTPLVPDGPLRPTSHWQPGGGAPRR